MIKINNTKRSFKAVILVVVAAVIGLTGIGTVVASENSKPGDLLFPVKQIVQDVTGSTQDQSKGTETENRGSETEETRGGDDIVNGAKLRGNGSVDDNSVSGSGQDDVVSGQKLRGNGTVDDNSSSASTDDSSGSNRGKDGNRAED